MNRRILYIIAGALLIFLLLLGLWFWLFGGNSSTVSQVGDLFGSGTTTSSGSGGTTGSGNGQAPIGSTVGSNTVNTQTPIGSGYSGGSYQTSGSGGYSDSGTGYDTGNGSATYTGGSGYSTDATWLDGSYYYDSYSDSSSDGSSTTTSSSGSGSSSSSSSGGSGSLYKATSINSVDNSSVSGSIYIVNSSSSGSSGSSLGEGLAGVAAGCIAQYFTQKGSVAASSGFGSLLSAITGQVRTYDQNSDASATTDTVFQCVVRSIARLAVRQITAETIDWINSGFNGKPQFVQDYRQFFSDVADKAAGDFIQGSGLSFLCSPFKAQVKVAIAQSYAKRQSGAVQSCTLSSAIGNVDKFMKGDFSQGGWPGLISFTTMPTNNPYGAYMYAQVGLDNAQNQAVSIAGQEIQAGQGFIPLKKCDVDSKGVTLMETCKIVSPGTEIAATVSKIIGSDLDQSIGLSNSISDIYNALANSLIKKAFQGFSNLGSSNSSSSSSVDSAAEQKAANLINEMQAYIQYAQQFGSIQQGSIQDVQNAQSNLSTLAKCWASAGKSDKQTAVESQIQDLEGEVTKYNDYITKANSAISTLQSLESDIYLAKTSADVDAVESDFTNAKSSGLISSADVTLASQNRTSLQAQMSSLNNTTSSQLQQCYASS